MSEENKQSPTVRRKRVQRLKKMIILVWMTLLMIPIVCCIFLFGRVRYLNQSLESMDERLAQISLLLEQQQQAERLAEMAVQVTVDGGNEEESMSGAQIQNPQGAETTGVLERSATHHKVYLTFDDGPSIYTDDILDILKQYDIKATFFVVGKEDEYSQEMLQRIVEEGHSLGMHSYSHKYSELYESEESFAEDFKRLQDYLYDVTGIRSTIYRFPGGSSNTVSKTPMEELFAYLDAQGVTYYDWNVAAQDASSRHPGVQEIVKNSIQNVDVLNTSIILMHDAADKRTTVEALPIIIEKLLEMENTEILPITEDTAPIQHRSLETKEGMEG
ncbi:MAG: polysaccharide deacetylase [Lachnospiraceae bacterium]|nr:polysaccharide deacetylase [Lachnospiraceae bacterium]